MAESKKPAAKKKAAAKKKPASKKKPAAKKPAAKKEAAAEKPAAAQKPAAEEEPKPKPKLPKLADVEHWVGLRVDGVGSRTLGRVAGLHVDADDGEPRWVVLRLGPLAGSTAIPYEHVAEGAGRLWAAYERDWVREAPRFRPNEALSAEDELELCAHWGIREHQGRSEEIAGRDADEITSVPAEFDG